MLFLDGVYAEGADGRMRFLWVKAPASAELIQLAHALAQRIGRYLERQGLLDRDADDCKCRMRARLQGEGETGNRSRGWPGPCRR
jgi:hypothetical protein